MTQRGRAYAVFAVAMTGLLWLVFASAYKEGGIDMATAVTFFLLYLITSFVVVVLTFIGLIRWIRAGKDE